MQNVTFVPCAEKEDRDLTPPLSIYLTCPWWHSQFRCNKARRGKYKRQFLLRSTSKRHFKCERVCERWAWQQLEKKANIFCPPFFQLAELVCSIQCSIVVQCQCAKMERGVRERDFWGLSCNTSALAVLQLQHHGRCCISIAVFLSCCVLLKRHIFFLLFLMYCTLYAVLKKKGGPIVVCALKQRCTAIACCRCRRIFALSPELHYATSLTYKPHVQKHRRKTFLSYD